MWGEGVFWGAWGLGVKVLVRDWLRVIAKVAAIAAPPLVTAAVPRELRIDRREKKTKGRELRRVAPRIVGGRGNSSHWPRASTVTFFSWKTGTMFSKRFGFGEK